MLILLSFLPIMHQLTFTFKAQIYIMYTYFNTSITTMTMTTAITISSKDMIIPAAIAPPEPPPVLGSLLVELVEVELVVIGGPVVANKRPLYSDYVISVSLDAVAVVGIIIVDEVLGTTVGVRVTPNEKNKIMKQ